MKIFAIRCKKCKDIVFSRTRHDVRYCSCLSCAVDGGQEDYFKVSGDDYEMLTLESNIKNKELFDDWTFGRDIFGILKEKDFDCDGKTTKKYKTFIILKGE